MKDLELENILVGHFIGNIPQGNKKPVSYVMDGGGLWEVRKNVLGVFRNQITNIHIPGIPCNLTEGFDLFIPKIPLSLLWQAISFFRGVYELHHSEAIVRVIYDRKIKQYSLDCPSQIVNAVHCDFSRQKTLESCIVVAEIHSHGKISACFSSTDDKDELADRFYGVIGKVTDFFPQMCFRISIGGKHLLVDISELFDVESDPILNAKFPLEWLDKVKEKKVEKKVVRKYKSMRSIDDPDDPENDEMLFLPGWDFIFDYEDGEEKEL